jgi:hypothetical protein
MCYPQGINARSGGVSMAPLGASADKHNPGSINKADYKGMRVVVDNSAKDLSLFNSALFKRGRASIDDGSMPEPRAENERNKSIGKLTVSRLEKFDANRSELDTKPPVRSAENGPGLLNISKIKLFDTKPQIKVAADKLRLQGLLDRVAHSRSLLSNSQVDYLSGKNALPEPKEAQLSAEESEFLGMSEQPPAVSAVIPSAPPFELMPSETIGGNDMEAAPAIPKMKVQKSPKKSLASKMKSFFSGLMALASKIFHQKEQPMKA